MMTRNADKKREQMLMFCMDDMVPQNHMLRLIDKAIDWNFIYDLAEEKYCPDNGRPSMDPVMLIKIPFIQYLYGIKSMRQTMKEIEVNVAYRWFLGLDMMDAVPHFSTFGKNYTRRFKDTDLFEQIFSRILEECMKYKLVDTSQIFVDSTHVKACANSKKMRKRIAHEQALWYEDELKKEIEQDRQAHGKKPLKEKDKHQPPTSGGSSSENPDTSGEIPLDVKTQKSSITDPESGWFRKGEHKHVFAYTVETACDQHGWILGYSVHPGNEHDSRTFKSLYEKVKLFDGYQVYHTLEKEREDLKIAGCWVHCRRKFDEALSVIPKELRKQSVLYLILKQIQAIYREEGKLTALSSEERLKQRQLVVQPLVDAFFSYLKQNKDKVGKSSKAKEAFTYALNQEPYLRVFLEDGDVPMDNNASERAIRGFCIGKKNWEMIDTIHGANSSAIIYSIAETAKANNLKPYEYFEYLLTEIPKHLEDTNRDFLAELLPWAKTLPKYIRKPGKK